MDDVSNKDELIATIKDIGDVLSSNIITLIGSVGESNSILNEINDNIKKSNALFEEDRLDRKRDRMLTPREIRDRNAERSTLVGGLSRGIESGVGGILGGIGSGVGILSRFIGVGAGLASLGVGIGGFFLGLSAADSAISRLGNGDSLVELMTNIGQGIGQLDTESIVGLASILAVPALVSPFMSLRGSFRTPVGMTAIGLGIGGFMAGMAAAGDITGFQGATFAVQARNIADGISAFENLSTGALTVLGGLAGVGALMGLVSPIRSGQVAVGMTMAGLGIGGFMTGMVAAGDITGFQGAHFAVQARNVVDGISEFERLPEGALIALGAIAGIGAIGGAVALGPTAFASLGMGLAGAGIGAFMTGMVAMGDITGFQGYTFAAQARNIAEGLSAFNNRDFSALGALMVAGGIFGATGAGTLAAGGAAIGMGLIGLGIGAFFSGIAAGGSLSSWMGADGSALRDIMVNIAEGIQPFGEIDGRNIRNIGSGLTSLSAGLAALFAIDLAQGVMDSWSNFWSWVTGEGERESRFQSIVDELQVFNNADFSGITSISNSGIAAALTSLGSAFSAFPTGIDALPTSQIDQMLNFVEEIVDSVSDDENYVENINTFTEAMRGLATSLGMFDSINLDALSRFSFGNFGRDIAIGAEAMDVAMNGGTVYTGTNITVARGLSDQAEAITETIRNLDLLISGVNQIGNVTNTILENSALQSGGNAPVLAPVMNTTDASVNTTNTTTIITTDPSSFSLDPSVYGP